MDSYKRKAVAKSLEIRRRRLRYLKRGLTFIYFFVPTALILYCASLLYQNNFIVKGSNAVANGGDVLEEVRDIFHLNLAEKLLDMNRTTVSDEKLLINDTAKDNKNTDSGKDIVGDNSQEKKVDGKYSNKTIYITFDDGPSNNTEEILEVLDKYHVKATFFVIGKRDEHSIAMYKKIVDEGHALGLHSFTHNYDSIYKSVEDFEKDFTKLRDLLYDTTGYLPNIYRFPGGSATLVGKHVFKQIAKFLEEQSVEYYDWNVLNGDATGMKYTEEQLIDNVLQGVEKHDHGIVLMHDANSKKSTVNSLERLLNILISNGATLLPIDGTVEPVQQVKYNP